MAGSFIMAEMKYASSIEDLKARGVTSLREEYKEVAESYNSILDMKVLRCSVCGDFKKADTGFYQDIRFISNRYPICKECVLKMVEQRNKKTDESNETPKSVQRVLMMMDKVYDDDFYQKCVKGATDGVKEKNRHSPFATYITAIMSLPQWQGKTYADSDFGSTDIRTELDEETIRMNEELLRKAKERFGDEYNNADLLFLEKEYEDWTTRNVCESKTQELLFKRICFKELEIEKAQKQGKDTKELDKTLQELLSSAQLKPSQNASNTLTEAKTFGQLIEKWEQEKPIPEPSDEFKDVDKIGQLIDVFFKGHLAKMMGIKNAFSATYDRFMQKYTVTKPEYEDSEFSEEIFDRLFSGLDE